MPQQPDLLRRLDALARYLETHVGRPLGCQLTRGLGLSLGFPTVLGGFAFLTWGFALWIRVESFQTCSDSCPKPCSKSWSFSTHIPTPSFGRFKSHPLSLTAAC